MTITSRQWVLIIISIFGGAFVSIGCKEAFGSAVSEVVGTFIMLSTVLYFGPFAKEESKVKRFIKSAMWGFAGGIFKALVTLFLAKA